MTAPAVPGPNRLEATTRRMSALSISAYSNPYRRFAWPAAAPADSLAMSRALSPSAALPCVMQLGDEQRWRLALLEATSFFSLNIAGERELMVGLAARLFGNLPLHVSHYLQHFLHEENAHTVAFARFCLDYGGVIFRPLQLRFDHAFLPGEEEFLFFARVLVFEEIAHFYNQQLADDDSLWPIARDINRYHAEDEARHISFGRALVADLWEQSGARWSAEQKRGIAGYLARYVQTVLRSYVNPDVYRTLGLAADARELILVSPHWIALAERSSRSVTRWLRAIGAGDPSPPAVG